MFLFYFCKKNFLKKILVIRFSSIGDIVLTSPILRCLKLQMDNVEIHFITKEQFVPLIKENPYIEKIYSIKKSLKEVISKLKAENYDYIVDLHKNIRSFFLILYLRKPFSTFNKLNFRKYLLVNFKINFLPDIHIVDRYFKAVRKFGVINDGKGLDYFIPEDEEINISELPPLFSNGFIGFIIGGKHKTKMLLTNKIISICRKVNRQVIILGGKEDKERGDIIKKAVGDKIYNACGKYTINQSASLVKQADIIVTNDTGLMHIAAAFKKNIISIWGSTVPAFGMYPYMPEGEKYKSKIIEVKNLSCRPCSKIGFSKCPKKHFKCINLIDEQKIVKLINDE